MKLPRKGILIRLCIYLPIIGYLVWAALAPKPEPAPASSSPTSDQPQDLPRRTFKAGDGSKFEVIEVTPEQARKMGAQLPESEPTPAQ